MDHLSEKGEQNVIPQTIVREGTWPESLRLVDPDQTLISPSLVSAPGSESPAYELKFLLTEKQAREVEEWGRRHLISDPYADPGRGHGYQTTSLYCDTAQFDVFHRQKPYKRRKHRLRRYGQSDAIFLERKSKKGDVVKKRRTVIPQGDLELLAMQFSSTDWAGHWFHRHILRKELKPVCLVSYDRIPLVGSSPEGPLRLTFDRNLKGSPCNEWKVENLKEGIPILPGEVICEFKYRTSLPILFKEMIQEMKLVPRSVSKYRTLLQATGQVVDHREVQRS